ncbi:MAG: MarR family winged helix-turn-helix transcriptional regulator [Clostridiales bacterium]|nr:MarR family winged helix-turn-helix transcriptional regulator [Clostridiales bacterium]
MMNPLYKSDCYCTNLRRCAAFISDFYDKSMKKIGLTIAQYYLLINLSGMKSANITHWAQRVGLDRSTMVRNVRVLEKYGYITLTEGHGKTYVLTSFGNETLSAAIPVWEKLQKQIESFLGKEDTAAILRISAKLQMQEIVAFQYTQ